MRRRSEENMMKKLCAFLALVLSLVFAGATTALVLMMSVPALALFYGGMVRSKNALSMLMQVFVVFSLVTVLWCIYGYSLAFTEGNRFFGGFDRLFLKGTFDPVKGEFST